jgi:hypothetical protein
MRRDRNCGKYSDAKTWVIKAVIGEEKESNKRLWEKGPSAEEQHDERLRRIRFLRKWAKTEPTAATVADRLETCEFRNRCLSGACPECGRLFQRWLVRKSRKFIKREIGDSEIELIAITIIPDTSAIQFGKLRLFSIQNALRRLKFAMSKAKITTALGGIDFSFNEDRANRYQPFWSVHYYIIAASRNRKYLKAQLRKQFNYTAAIPRPVKICCFDNSAYARSYILKMKFDRRIGYDEWKETGTEIRECRNTSRDKLRAAERLELFLYLEQIGLARRLIFRNCKPINSNEGVAIKRVS